MRGREGELKMMGEEVGEIYEKAPGPALGRPGLHPEGHREPWKH